MITYIASVLTLGTIFAILALALNVRYGWTGELDISLFAFVAIGAYVSAVTTLPPSKLPLPNHYILGLSQPFLLGVAYAMIVCGLLSLLVGSIALRSLRGDHFAITTVATTLIIYAVISQNTYIFNGFAGVYGLPEPFNGMLDLGPDGYSLFYLGLCLVALLLVYLFLERLYHSPFGRALRSTREDEVASAAFGRNVYWLKLQGYAVGGVIAGMGGALLAHFLTAFNPYAWDTAEVFLLYAAIFVGGVGNQRGVLMGTVFVIVLIQEATRFLPLIPGHADAQSAIRFILIGLLIIGVLKWRPQGLLPEPRARDPRTLAPVERTAALAGGAHESS
ncbi:MAG TPA: branched-chain amino acid ABC transporter permease [Chloroflexota bacterium]|jgi:ABC-type branched-subunit amino acid transport system permease subunit|nr:branched-chain amino acid ABC transporter permease [Chloroflexota bacterium]